MKQKEAVYRAVKKVLDNSGTWFEESKEQVVLRREDREAVVEELVRGFLANSIELDSNIPSNVNKLKNETSLRQYCSGLVSNWLRKDTRLNGGVIAFYKRRLFRRGDDR